MSEQKTSGGSGAPFSFVPAGPKTPNARVLLVGNIGAAGSPACPSAAEAGEGRKTDVSVVEVSSGESEDEGVPKRGVSAPPPSGNLNRGGIAPKTDIGWKEEKAMFRRFGHPNAWSDHGSRSPVVVESYDSFGPTRLHLEIVSASAMPGVEFNVSPPLDVVKQLTQSVVQLSLRMDTGGWVLVADFASKLGITTEELIARARHYPSECIEFSLWKDPSNSDGAHLHAVRASFGHIYPWIRVDRLGMPVNLTQLNELNDLHVFIRPIFMETVVLNGIVTRQHQGHERMSTDFCTHIVVSNAKVSHMDRLRLGAEFADYVLFLD